MLKRLGIIFGIILASCGSSDEQSICDRANDLAQSAMNEYCAGRTCCICICNNTESVMECGGQVWDCATPPYNQVAHPDWAVCPTDDEQAQWCLDDEQTCWDGWYAVHQGMCEAYP